MGTFKIQHTLRTNKNVYEFYKHNNKLYIKIVFDGHGRWFSVIPIKRNITSTKLLKTINKQVQHLKHMDKRLRTNGDCK